MELLNLNTRIIGGGGARELRYTQIFSLTFLALKSDACWWQVSVPISLPAPTSYYKSGAKKPEGGPKVGLHYGTHPLVPQLVEGYHCG